MIKSIQIKNFKSIGEKEQTLNNVGRINILIGENNSGKTAALEILWLVGEIILNLLKNNIPNVGLFIEGLPFGANDFLPKIKNIVRNIDRPVDFVHQKKDKIEIGIVFDTSNVFYETIEERLKNNESIKNKIINKVKDLNLIKLKLVLDFKKCIINIQDISWGNLKLTSDDYKPTRYLHLENYFNVLDYEEEYALTNFGLSKLYKDVFLPEIRNLLNYLSSTYYIHSKRTIQEIIHINDSLSKIKGSNLKQEMFELFHGEGRKKYLEILEIFKQVTNKSIREVPFKTPDQRLDVVFEEGDTLVNIDNSGYGHYHLLSLIYNIIISQADIILIDEPEISLHPQVQIALFNFIIKLANDKNKQFFISSHSPYFIDLNIIDNIYKFSKLNDVSTITKISNDKIIQRIKEQREGIFHFKHRELFFLDKVIFVEGDNDLDILSNFLEDKTKVLSISKECLYKINGINDDKINIFSSICKELGIKYVFLADVDFLRKDKRFIKILKDCKQKNSSYRQLLKILNKTQIKDEDKKTIKTIWDNYWSQYWNLIKIRNLVKNYKTKNIFIMPFYDVKSLINKSDEKMNTETLNIIKEIDTNFNLQKFLPK